MKVWSSRMASGVIELCVTDNSGATCTMRFKGSKQMRVFCSAVAFEVDRQKEIEEKQEGPRQLSLF